MLYIWLTFVYTSIDNYKWLHTVLIYTLCTFQRSSLVRSHRKVKRCDLGVKEMRAIEWTTRTRTPVLQITVILFWDHWPWLFDIYPLCLIIYRSLTFYEIVGHKTFGIYYRHWYVFYTATLFIIMWHQFTYKNKMLECSEYTWCK